jgi:hypothetical protein
MPDGGSGTPIFGLAICRYKNSGAVYRFSCNSDWETENDSAWGDSIQQAIEGPSTQYDIRRVQWIKYASSEGSDPLLDKPLASRVPGLEGGRNNSSRSSGRLPIRETK